MGPFSFCSFGFFGRGILGAQAPICAGGGSERFSKFLEMAEAILKNRGHVITPYSTVYIILGVSAHLCLALGDYGPPSRPQNPFFGYLLGRGGKVPKMAQNGPKRALFGPKFSTSDFPPPLKNFTRAARDPKNAPNLWEPMAQIWGQFGLSAARNKNFKRGESPCEISFKIGAELLTPSEMGGHESLITTRWA